MSTSTPSGYASFFTLARTTSTDGFKDIFHNKDKFQLWFSLWNDISSPFDG